MGCGTRHDQGMASVVADASALLAFTRIGQLDLLRQLFQEVTIPPAVAREVAVALPSLPDWIRVIKADSTHAARGIVGLHAGEIEAIGLALDLRPSLLILDDLPARRHAIGLGLAIVGTAGALVMAKRAGLIPSVRDELDALRRTGFPFVRTCTSRSLPMPARQCRIESGRPLANPRAAAGDGQQHLCVARHGACRYWTVRRHRIDGGGAHARGSASARRSGQAGPCCGRWCCARPRASPSWDWPSVCRARGLARSGSRARSTASAPMIHSCSARLPVAWSSSVSPPPGSRPAEPRQLIR